MKKLSSALFIAAFAIISAFLFLFIDCKMYYYGESKYNVCKKTLPLGLKPDYWDSRVAFPVKGFTIIDKFGLVLFQKGKRITIDNDSIEINEIIDYSFNDDSIIITCIDVYGVKHLVECTKTFDKQHDSKLLIKILETNSVSLKSNFKRVDLKNNREKRDNYEQLRTGSVFGFIFITIVFLFGSYIMNKRRTNSEK